MFCKIFSGICMLIQMLYLQFTLAVFLGFEVLIQFLFGIAVLYYQSALFDSRIFRAGITFTIKYAV